MMTVVHAIASIVLWLAVAPIVPGIINKVKAWFAGRTGPPVLQLYYDIARQWRKGTVLSTAASPGHLVGPAVAFISLAAATMFLPLGRVSAPIAFEGDALLFVYLMGLARFAMAASAMDAGSSFEGMGAAREVSYAVLGEVAIITALLVLGVQTGSASLTKMLAPAAGPGTALLAAGLYIVLLAENCRVPFDDPNTHLELTMIHEVMVLDHSGPPLAAILHGAALKLLIFCVLVTEVMVPLGRLPIALAAATLVAVVLATAVGAGVAESGQARLPFRRVPMLLTTAFLLCLFALMIAWGS